MSEKYTAEQLRDAVNSLLAERGIAGTASVALQRQPGITLDFVRPDGARNGVVFGCDMTERRSLAECAKVGADCLERFCRAYDDPNSAMWDKEHPKPVSKTERTPVNGMPQS